MCAEREKKKKGKPEVPKEKTILIIRIHITQACTE